MQLIMSADLILLVVSPQLKCYQNVLQAPHIAAQKGMYTALSVFWRNVFACTSYLV